MYKLTFAFMDFFLSLFMEAPDLTTVATTNQVRLF